MKLSSIRDKQNFNSRIRGKVKNVNYNGRE